MLGELAFGVDAEDVERDERLGAEAVVDAVQRDEVAVGEDARALVVEAG